MATTAEQIAQIQQQNNEMYQQNAREQRSWEEQMSNTAHRREMKDLIAAGLNPVLTATGGQGASTPSGATAEVDTQSMVSYLINEMNNENARQLNSAQVAAQRYAAEMSYKAAQTAAWAQVRSSEIAAGTTWLGAFTNALSDPNSPQALAIKTLCGWLGIKLPSSGKDAVDYASNILQQTVNGAKSVVAEYKAINMFQSSWNKIKYNKPANDYLKQNSQSIVDYFKALGYNKLASLFMSTVYGSSAK